MASPLARGYRISDTGLSVVSEPEAGTVVADIVFIHGLQGHPYRTWALAASAQAEAATGHRPEKATSPAIGTFRRILTKSVRSIAGSSLGELRLTSDPGYSLAGKVHATEPSLVSTIPELEPVYWPGDLLPSECPNARILAWGYDTVITKKLSAPSNKNTILSHAKDLLFSLHREHPIGRPVIFVAHSLGGIITKEMLAHSADSDDQALCNIVESTAAVVFLGTPHRGSPQMAGLGETVRKAASSILRMDTSPAALDALGLKTSDLERCQETFSRLWRDHDFSVKTFQEGLGLTGVNIGPLSDKVVPDYSSVLGDAREHAETLQANHMNMCRFTGIQDPNYRKVAGELRQICNRIGRANQGLHPPTLASHSVVADRNELATTPSNTDILSVLRFPKMHRRLRAINEPARQTCQWLFHHPTFTAWLKRENVEHDHGLLWIRGKPGSGKSTLLREAYRKVSRTDATAFCCAFFFDGKGDSQSRLAESLEKCQQQQSQGGNESNDSEVPWNEAEMMKALEETINGQRGERIILFIDAIDECDSDRARDIAYFLRDLTDSAYSCGVYLSVCFTSRHFPFISLRNCPVICVEDYNATDIALYVSRKFEVGGLDQAMLMDSVLAKASGVFLWVVLVSDRLLRDYDEGASERQLIARLSEIPVALAALFTELLSKNREDARTTVRFFQWAVLGGPNMRLREWRHILGFIRHGTFRSLRMWQESTLYPETDEQLERQLHNISIGLVEVVGGKLRARGVRGVALAAEDADSVGAGAGSLAEEGETRTVQVVHQSVRDFFLHENGFSALDPTLSSNAVGRGHVAILNNCFDYISLQELDSLIAARESVRAREREAAAAADGGEQKLVLPTRQHRPPSVASFDSAGSGGFRVPSVDSSENSDAQTGGAGFLDELNGRYAAVSDFRDYRISLLSHGDENGTGEESPNNGSRGSSPKPLVKSIEGLVLEADLPLLTYSTTMPTFHAKRAEAEGVALEEVTLRLLHGGLWRRWQLLREDIHPEHTFMEYAVEQNITSWIGALLSPLGAYQDPLEVFQKAVKHDKGDVIDLLVRRDIARTNDRFGEHLLCRLIDSRRHPKSGGNFHTDAPLIYLRSLGKLIEKSGSSPTSFLGGFDNNPVCCTSASVPYATPLHLAARVLDEPLCALLLQLGAEVNAADIHGNRPIDRACVNSGSSCAVVQLLIQHHADVRQPKRRVPTPLQYVCMHCEENASEAARLLISAGAEINPRGTRHASPLFLACAAFVPDAKLIQLLIEHGASVDYRNRQGQTALHVVRGLGQVGLGAVDQLLQAGCQANTLDNTGRSALHEKCLQPIASEAFIRRLIESDRQLIHLKDLYGNTPLHSAVRWSNYTVVRTLLEYGARLNDVNGEGHAPIYILLTRLNDAGQFYFRRTKTVAICRTILSFADQRQYTSPELTALQTKLMGLDSDAEDGAQGTQPEEK